MSTRLLFWLRHRRMHPYDLSAVTYSLLKISNGRIPLPNQIFKFLHPVRQSVVVSGDSFHLGVEILTRAPSRASAVAHARSSPLVALQTGSVFSTIPSFTDCLRHPLQTYSVLEGARAIYVKWPYALSYARTIWASLRN